MVDKEYTIPIRNRLYCLTIALACGLLGAGLLLAVNDSCYKLFGVVFILLFPLAIWTALTGWPPIRVISDAIAIGKKRYPYARMRRVRMVTPPPLKEYPQIQIEGDFDSPAPLILRINYDIYGRELPADRSFRSHDWYGTQSILGDLLARLPPHVEVDSSVRTYTKTGSLPPISTLPTDGRLG